MAAPRALRFAAIGGALVVLFLGGWLAGRLGIGSVVNPASLSEVERQFAERMNDASLVGTFTIWGREGRPASPDRYDIKSVEKIGDDLWRFNASMSCCGVNGTIPIPVPLRFVGDTPVIMMTDTSLPGLGTFTVRLFFYGDSYSGTWSHGKVGGHMSGRIEKRGAPAAAKSTMPAAQRLIGAWQLASRVVTKADGTVLSDAVLGAEPLGRLYYDVSGVMSLQMMRQARTAAIGKPGNPQDAANPRAILGYDSYFGTYTVDEAAGTITHHVQGSLFPEDLGKDWVRPFTLDEGTLTLKFTSAGADGVDITRTLIFRRQS